MPVSSGRDYGIESFSPWAYIDSVELAECHGEGGHNEGRQAELLLLKVRQVLLKGGCCARNYCC